MQISRFFHQTRADGVGYFSSLLKGHWAVSVNGNWRMTFTFDGTDAVLVDYLDYH
jgi:plasmid maintenance system killer protein